MLRATIFVLAITGLQAADYKDFDKTIALSPNGALTIENHKGGIRVTTWDRADVEIHARIQAEPGEPMDRRRFDATEIVVDGSGASVRVRTQYGDDWCCSMQDGNNPEVRYTIRMPRTASLTIRDHRSDTEITNLAGALDVDTHRGTVHVKGLAGPLQLATHRGQVTVEFASFTGDSMVDTHRGSIELLIPRNSRFDFRSETDKRASVSTDFPSITRPVSKVNGGGPTLKIKSHAGDIRVRAT